MMQKLRCVVFFALVWRALRRGEMADIQRRLSRHISWIRVPDSGAAFGGRTRVRVTCEWQIYFSFCQLFPWPRRIRPAKAITRFSSARIGGWINASFGRCSRGRVSADRTPRRLNERSLGARLASLMRAAPFPIVNRIESAERKFRIAWLILLKLSPVCFNEMQNPKTEPLLSLSPSINSPDIQFRFTSLVDGTDGKKKDADFATDRPEVSARVKLTSWR